MATHEIVDAGSPVLRAQTLLGEGPVWNEREQVLYFVDIPRGEIHRFDPSEDSHSKESYGKPIGNIVLRERQPGILVAAARELYKTDPSRPGLLFPIAQPVPEESKCFQFNDGYCDRLGRWLTGTKSDENPGSEGTADLYSFSLDGTTTLLIPSITVSNGLAFSPDDKLMYFIDTPSGTIDLYDYDLSTGSVSNKREFARLPAQRKEDVGRRGEGGFDGMCTDTDGNLYVALWQRSVLYRYSPEGEITLEIRFPNASNITAPVFGGKEMDELYVTTASCIMSREPELVQAYSEGGDVYRIKIPGVRGREKFRCAWEGDVE